VVESLLSDLVQGLREVRESRMVSRLITNIWMFVLLNNIEDIREKLVGVNCVCVCVCVWRGGQSKKQLEIYQQLFPFRFL
jgi:hypothetical protein